MRTYYLIDIKSGSVKKSSEHDYDILQRYDEDFWKNYNVIMFMKNRYTMGVTIYSGNHQVSFYDNDENKMFAGFLKAMKGIISTENTSGD